MNEDQIKQRYYEIIKLEYEYKNKIQQMREQVHRYVMHIYYERFIKLLRECPFNYHILHHVPIDAIYLFAWHTDVDSLRGCIHSHYPELFCLMEKQTTRPWLQKLYFLTIRQVEQELGDPHTDSYNKPLFPYPFNDAIREQVLAFCTAGLPEELNRVVLSYLLL